MKIVPSVLLVCSISLAPLFPVSVHAQLAGAAATKAATTQLRVQVQVANQQRRIANSFRKESTIQPKIVIDGAAATRPLPPLEATMVIITMDTRAKYKEKREVYKVESTETLPLAAAPNGARRTFEFAPTAVSYDAWRDTTNVGGATYKYYISGIRDPETREIIDFQTNHPGLATLAKSNPERREEFLTINKGAEFPETVK